MEMKVLGFADNQYKKFSWKPNGSFAFNYSWKIEIIMQIILKLGISARMKLHHYTASVW